jgi:hypothetical protein
MEAYKVGAVKKVSGPVVVGEGMAGALPIRSVGPAQRALAPVARGARGCDASRGRTCAACCRGRAAAALLACALGGS